MVLEYLVECQALYKHYFFICMISFLEWTACYYHRFVVGKVSFEGQLLYLKEEVT